MTDDILTWSLIYGIMFHKKGRDYMKELILLLLLVFIVLPVAVISGIVLLIIRLVKRHRNKAMDFILVESPKTERKFSSSEIMFIIGTLFIILSGIAFGCAGWVNTSPVGRVLIIFSAAAVMSGAGILFRRKLKLNSTATAFGITGTILLAVTIITAGYYELFGKWFSISGDGKYMLFAVSSAIVSAVSYMESKLVGSNAFKYLSCISMTLTLIFMSGQFAGSYSTFAVIMSLMQTIVSIWFVFGNIKDNVIKTSVKLSMVIFSVLAFIWVTDRILVPDGAAYFIMLLALVQLIGYGIYLNNDTLKNLQGILGILTAFVFVNDIQQNDDKAVILFSSIMLLIYSANRFILHLKSKFSEILTLGFAVWSAIASATLNEPTAVIMPVVMSALIMLYAFSESKSIQFIAGVCSPVLPLIIAVNRNTYDILVIVLCLVTAGIIYLPEYAFNLYARFSRKTNAILYANMIAAGIITALWTTDSPDNLALALISCGIHIVVSFLMKNNMTGILSAFGIVNVITELPDMHGYRIFLVFCSFMVLARIFFGNGVIIRKNDSIRFDIITLTVWGMFALMNSDFLRLISVAVYMAGLVRRKTNRFTGNILLSISAFVTMLAMNNRPFFISESEIIENKIFLGIIAVMGIAYRYIWKNLPKVSKNISDMIFILSFAGLVDDVMKYHRLGNTIFGLVVTAAILIVSFTTKNRRWFCVSSVALVTITVWASVRYFGKLDWWVYLFIAGIIFIAVASISEYFKSRDKKLSDIFADWK